MKKTSRSRKGKKLPAARPAVQTEIPGAGRISNKELAERKMQGALRPRAKQKSADEGLFDVAGRGQAVLF